MKKIFGLILLASLACKKQESVATTTATATTATTSTTATAATAPPVNTENLLALGSGALPVIRASSPDQNGSAYYMFDDDSGTGWTSNDHKFNEPTVVEMADRGLIKRLEFDEQRIEYDGRLPKKLLVEVSDTNATTGFKAIAEVSLPEMKDGVAFPVTAEVPGRWVRVTVEEGSSDSGIVQVMEVRGFGERLSHNPMPANVTGTYDTDAGQFHLKQEGATVTGCYDRGTELLNGGMEGRLLKFRYATGENGSGPALLVVSDDGHVFGGWWRTDGVEQHPKLDPIEGKRISADPGNTACPQWKAPQSQLGDDMKKKGRVRLYGINFDSDSDVIRPESKPTLDQVASMLKENADWHVTIEGHTDATSTPEHNQDLSARRANSVKQYLVTAGIDTGRLDATGFGSSKPVATNDSTLGRAANRRVELVKK